MKEWVSVAGPFAGTVKEVKIMTSGDNEGVAWVKDMTIREEQR
ncbi:MAG: lipase/acyltransferase domain-containing protein [bacterium]